MVALLIVFTCTSTSQASDVFKSFQQLKSRYKEDVDFCIGSINRDSSTLVMAIHGGSIEIGTSQIARSVAKILQCDLYLFEGIRDCNNNLLHITSTNFNEPRAHKLVNKSDLTLSIHGCRGTDEVTYIGGLDSKTGKKITKHLQAAGFKVKDAPTRLSGQQVDNICNQNSTNKGVQLELTYAMRQLLLYGSEADQLFENYTEALAAAME
jgi:phage replication-related protein YjqB (UPF0714/DUF867 family)